MPHFVLRCYLASRLGHDPSHFLSIQELLTQEIAFRNMSPTPNPMLPPQHIPKQYTHWIFSEVIAVIDGSQDWNKDSVHEIVDDEACVPIIGNK